jgi:anti-sigma factor RsiW
VSSRLELLHAYHDGELGPLRRWQVRRWLARDAAARRELEALAGVGEAVRQAYPAPPAPDLWAGLEGRLRSIDAEGEAAEATRSPERLGLRLGPFYRPAAAGAVLAAVVAVFVLLLGPEATPQAGVVRWLDTHGQSVMVLDEGDATIIWLMQPDADQAGGGGGWLGLI